MVTIIQFYKTGPGCEVLVDDITSTEHQNKLFLGMRVIIIRLFHFSRLKVVRTFSVSKFSGSPVAKIMVMLDDWKKSCANYTRQTVPTLREVSWRRYAEHARA